jgi:hypothetical protein
VTAPTVLCTSDAKPPRSRSRTRPDQYEALAVLVVMTGPSTTRSFATCESVTVAPVGVPKDLSDRFRSGAVRNVEPDRDGEIAAGRR